jgi:nuclease HARBI1
MLISAGDFAGCHKCTAAVIIREVSLAIANLAPQFIRFPQTPEEVRVVQGGFYKMNRFPRVLGAIDCTHIRIQSPGSFCFSFSKKKNIYIYIYILNY